MITVDVSSLQRTRIAALACLGILPDTIRYDVLHTVKTKVLKELAKAIDDPKRTVRREAVACRSKWYVLLDAAHFDYAHTFASQVHIWRCRNLKGMLQHRP